METSDTTAEISLDNLPHKNLVCAISNVGGVIHGGYVRDVLLGKMPNDIDVIVRDQGHAFRVLRVMSNFGRVTLCGHSPSVDAGVKCTVDFNVTVKVDLCIGMAPLDYTVNGLRLVIGEMLCYGGRYDTAGVTLRTVNEQHGEMLLGYKETQELRRHGLPGVMAHLYGRKLVAVDVGYGPGSEVVRRRHMEEIGFSM